MRTMKRMRRNNTGCNHSICCDSTIQAWHRPRVSWRGCTGFLLRERQEITWTFECPIAPHLWSLLNREIRDVGQLRLWFRSIGRDPIWGTLGPHIVQLISCRSLNQISSSWSLRAPTQNDSAVKRLILCLDGVRLHRLSSDSLLRLPCQTQNARFRCYDSFW